MNRTMTEEERLRKLGQVRAGIAPQGMPGVPGQPSRPAPAAGIAPVAPAAPPPLRSAAGIASVPKYGSMDYVRPDGSRRVVAGGQPEYNVVDGVQVPSSTPMRQTPNFDANVPDTPAPGVAPIAPRFGATIRRDPATGAAVQMPDEAWTRYDAAGAARRGGIAPVGSGQAAGAVQPAVGIAPQAAPVAPVAAAPAAPAAPVAAPAAGGLFPDRAAERQRQHDLAMDRSRYGLQRGGATSAAGREFDAARAGAADAARRTKLVEGQQALQREGQQLAAQSVRDKAALEGAAGVMGKQVEAQGASAVAGVQAGAERYKADKGAETALTMAAREQAARREARLEAAALKREEWDRRFGQDRQQIPDIELNDYVKNDAPAIRDYRAVNSRVYDPDPAKNEQQRLEAVRKLVVKHYGASGTGGWWTNKVSSKKTEAEAAEELMKELEANYGAFVDMRDQRFGGAGGGGATARPGGAAAAAAGRRSGGASQPGARWKTAGATR